MIRKKDALDYHEGKRPGKTEVIPTKPCMTQRDLSLAYSPGVAEPCIEIHKNSRDVFRYTNKGNLVAVVSNGTAVLGLGNIGALASKPVMEGKGVLFKRFAGIDVFDIEINSREVDDAVRTIADLEPTFGGINLEDFKAPECFEIERRLKECMNIPVFHDDQHGTAIVSGAALLNALEIAKKKIGDVRFAVSGDGASAMACANFFIELGADPEKILMSNSKGIMTTDRLDQLNKYQKEFARKTNCKTIAEAMVGADVFLGCSVGGLVKPAMIKKMAKNPIIFALANPDPEISFPDAIKARKDVIMATGRSDYPNQVNNVLGFPFIFRGALDVRARAISEEMKVASARALADLAKEKVPDVVSQAYKGEKLEFGPNYIIPKPLDPRILSRLAPAVAQAAIKSGVARTEINIPEYREKLESMMDPAFGTMRVIYHKAKKQESPKIIFPEGNAAKILAACQVLKDEGICEPILLGKEKEIKQKIKKYNLFLDDIEIIDPEKSEHKKLLTEKYYQERGRRGVSQKDAAKRVLEPNNFATMMLQEGMVDGMVSGLTTSYPETIRPVLQIIKIKEGYNRACGIYMMIFKNGVKFFADTTVNIDPDAEALSEIAIMTADLAEYFDLEPRIAMLSFSDFGSAPHEKSIKVRKAVEIINQKRPDLEVDGEMQADTALNFEIMQKSFPLCTLKKSPNIFIFPDLGSGNIAYKMVKGLGSAEAVGPILLGANKAVNILQRNCSVNDIVHIASLTALRAGEDKRGVSSLKVFAS